MVGSKDLAPSTIGFGKVFYALDDPENYDPQETYNTSKLLSHFFLWNLVDYVSADDVIINLADPAWVKGTALARDAKGVPPSEGLSISNPIPTIFITNITARIFAAMLYTPEGKVPIQRIWDETLSKFDFVGARAVLDSMKA